MADGGTSGEMLTRSMALRAIREDLREVDFVCSNEDVDSYDSRFIQAGIDFSRFEANPVVLFAHKSRDLPVGHAVRWSIQGDEFIATVRFASEKANPLAENVWLSILERCLRGISIGFDPLAYHFERDTPSGPEILVFDRIMLLELSIAPLPSNTGTLAKLRERAMAERADKRWVSATPSDNVTERAALPEQGSNMSLPATDAAALQTKVTELETKTRDLEFAVRESKKSGDEHEKRALDLTAKLEVIEAQNKRLVEERDAADKSRAVLEAMVIEREVEELIGKKIAPAERDSFVKLCKTDRALFDQMVAQRSDMKLTEQIIPSDKNDVPPPPALDARAKAKADAERDFAELQAAADKHD